MAKSKSAPKNVNDLSYEEALAELEEIVSTLEDEQSQLEDAIKLFDYQEWSNLERWQYGYYLFYYQYKYVMDTVCSVSSLTRNIGLDGIGFHLVKPNF